MFKLLNLTRFIKITAKLLPVLTISFLIISTYSIYLSFFNSPVDYQQGNLVRIMYIHVPSAWLALMIYVFISICSFVSIIWRTKLAYLLAIAAAPVGCCFAIITLITGAIWGKPTWGTWWVWDARLTSMLFLCIFYLSYIAIVNAGDNILRSEKPAAVISLIGMINVPIIKFSVDIWSSLHQPSSVFRLDGPTIHYSMLKPLMVSFTSLLIYSILVTILRVNIILSKIKAHNIKKYKL